MSEQQYMVKWDSKYKGKSVVVGNKEKVLKVAELFLDKNAHSITIEQIKPIEEMD